MKKRLRRSCEERMVAGVRGGLGEYLNLDPVIMRIILTLLVFANGIGILAYIQKWIAMPREETVGAPA